VDARDLRHLARLARLELDPDEVESLARDLAAVLDHFATIREVEVPLEAGSGASCPEIPESDLREDRPRPGLSRDDALRGAPDIEDGRFRTPRVPGAGP
jgi:aspartyl-tRNA(Asn)/glutamyl-tRNA(Gln) amidotransferase subunit C